MTAHEAPHDETDLNWCETTLACFHAFVADEEAAKFIRGTARGVMEATGEDHVDKLVAASIFGCYATDQAMAEVDVNEVDWELFAKRLTDFARSV